MNNETTTFAQLVAMRDAGEITGLTFTRAARFHHRAAYDAHRAAERAAERATLEAQRAAQAKRAATRYTDETLRANLTSDAPGLRREAEILLAVPADRRADVVRAAHRFRNATPDAGRWSDALRSCARDIR